MHPQHKYARIERERRFLLRAFPHCATVVEFRRIVDHYIEGTSLRLREQHYNDGLTTLKLTQKIPVRADGAQQGLITSIYLTSGEFSVLAQLPAKRLSKIRYSVPPFGIDVFEGALKGLLIAEAEFDSSVEAEALILPDFICCEVSGDDRFTGGKLVGASQQDIRSWLLDYGIRAES